MLENNYTVPSLATAPKIDCLIERTIKEFKNLPCSFGLTGRVHEEECDRSFSVFLLNNKERSWCLSFKLKKKNGEKGDD